MTVKLRLTDDKSCYFASPQADIQVRSLRCQILCTLVVAFLFVLFVGIRSLDCNGGANSPSKVPSLHNFLDSHSLDIISDTKNQNYRMVCYYVIPSNNSHTRPLPPEAIDPYYCTHIIIGFSLIENGTIQSPRSEHLEVYKKVISFKKFNPQLKVLLSVADMSSYGEFSRMVSSENLRSKFVSNTVHFLKTLGFDGLDLDWEFPAWPDADLNQVKNYSILISELRAHVDKVANDMILSAAVAAPDIIIHQSYEVEELATYLDFVHIMCYDYHMFTSLVPLTGPNAPLYPRPQEIGYARTLNTDYSTMLWVNLGMPREKINVGIPTYGHSFRLLNEDNNGWGAPAKDVGILGDGGFTTYPDACKFINDPKTNHVFDDSYQVPFATQGHEWLSYENIMSVTVKANYIKEQRFGGAMIFSLNADDFYGECGGQKFVLTREVNYVLQR